MIDYEVNVADRKLLSKVATALAYYNHGDPLKDFLGHEDITDALMLLMRVVPDDDRVEAVNSFVASYFLNYEEEPSGKMVNAAGGQP